MKQLKLLFLLAIVLSSIAVKAQMPVLKISNVTLKQPVTLQNLAIDVQIVGNVATTTMTMTFHNSDTRVLEGELTFPMPEGVTVSGYALDINGKMRAAVPVEKARATEVFESIQNRRIDPGLLEKVEGNNFRTRIYPIPSKGTRTIRISYEEELKHHNNGVFQYHLPLGFETPIAKFSLKTTILENTIRPELVEQPDGSFNFSSLNNALIAEMRKENYTAKKSLTINLPKRSEIAEVQLQKASEGYYFLVNVFPKTAPRKHQWSDQLGLIWDCSLSGLHRDTKKEMELLEMIISAQKNLTIQLGLLNNRFQHGGKFVIRNGDWSALKQKLTSIVYDGGTAFNAVNEKELPANEYILLSDGLSTFSTGQLKLSKPVYSINSSTKADYNTLKYISAKTGGEFINLSTLTIEEAFEQLSQQSFRYLGIKNSIDVRQTYPSLPVAVNGHLAVAGILGRYGSSVTLQFGYGNTVTYEQTIALNANTELLGSNNVSRIWAQKKIAEMDIQYDVNKNEITALGKQFGIVTRNTSLMVLENVDDYIRYAITPPAELLQAYNAVLKQRRMALMEQQKNLLDQAISMSKELKTWWNTDFYAKASKETATTSYPTPVGAVDSTARVTAINEQRNVQRAQQAQQAQRRQESQRPVASGTADDKQLNEVVVSAYGVARREVVGSTALSGKVAGVSVNQTTTQQQPAIVIPVFKSDKEYMAKLTGKGAEAYEQYLAIRPNYISTPSFYFDAANLFFEQGDSTRALTILSNIAELDLENADLFKLLGYKLKQIGNYPAALFISQKVLEWRPMDPQSYRDYALALADVGQYQKALDNLYKVLTQSYNEQARTRDEGIEEIVIAEINNLLTRHGKGLNRKAIDQRLVQPLPVDIRVVLNWNKKNTDIDLWLTDPNGEKCFYSNSATKIGGRISNDFTDGYGPEQFMLKKAVKGKYKIEVNFYGERQFTVSGPTTVMAEIYTRYATGKEERKIIVLPLYERNSQGNLIGEFVF